LALNVLHNNGGIRMYKQMLVVVAGCAALAGLADAQTRRASFLGGASGGQGKCTGEVWVDGAAEVEIRGDSATLRNLSGQPAQWRRFECTGALPPNPADFRFAGVDGRGSQRLMRDPRNGGTAVIRIEDPQGGGEGYTFDVFWGNGYASQAPIRQGNPPPYPPAYQDRGPNGGPNGRYEGDRGGFDGNRGGFDGNRGPGRRFTTEQAVDVCQSSIRQQAEQRFRTTNINFRQTALDDRPGRQDWVTGTFDVRFSPGREDSYNFTCSVNFDNGQVRSAQIGTRFRR